MDDVLGGERFKIQLVRRVVIGGNGFRIRVNHDGFKSIVTQGKAGVNTAVVEFDTLTDSVRTTPQDDNLGFLGRAGFVVVHIVGGVVVRGVSLKLRRAGVDEAIGGMDCIFLPPGSDCSGTGDQFLGRSRKSASEIGIGEAHLSGLPKMRNSRNVAQPILLLKFLG